ncbi:unnamed protein product [Zymoseptoria tritici ST99CH_3D1]|nr:unnamed protein product [Zymoseptoria tritici ST99CH_3D1]
MNGIDLVRLTATELQDLLAKGQLTRVQLIKQSLEQIQRHDKAGLQLQALISVAPETSMLDHAAKLDHERAKGQLRARRERLTCHGQNEHEYFPEQDKLVYALENPSSSSKAKEALEHARRVGGSEGVDKTMSENDVDLIALPMDSACARLATHAGYPIAAIPLDVLSYGPRPFGLAVIAKAGREDILFMFMSAFEAGSAPRPVLQRLVNRLAAL